MNAFNSGEDYGDQFTVNNSQFGNLGPLTRNTQNNFFAQGNQKMPIQGGNGLNPMNQTGFPGQTQGLGHLRNKSNGAKLSQYQGVHGTINGGVP